MLDQELAAGLNGGWEVEGGQVVGFDGGGLADFEGGVDLAVVVAGDGHATGGQPASGSFNLELAAGVGAVDATVVFDGGELLTAIGFVDDGAFAQGEGVEDKGFEFHGVGGRGFDALAGGQVDIRDLFLSTVIGQCKFTGGFGTLTRRLVQGFDEVDGDDVDGDGAG